MPNKTISRLARAKINLFLHVTSRRDDGYHDLQSLVVFADIGDEIRVSGTDDGKISLAVSGPFAGDIPTGGDNTVMKAANLLAGLAGGRATGVHIELVKNLPPASGIGGGSADAAATLRALADLWSGNGEDTGTKALLELWRQVSTDDIMQATARKIGADVPVCIESRAAIMEGIGEKLSPAPTLPPCWLVLACPGVPLPTPAAFAGIDGNFSAPAAVDGGFADAGELARWLEQTTNDLAPAAARIAPEIGDVIDELGRLDGAALARMSGSGSACFALFADEGAARAGADKLAALKPGWWVKPARVSGT